MAQQFTSSTHGSAPLSYFGIGEMEEKTYVSNQLMGGISSSLYDSLRINSQNPASLAVISNMVFTTGLNIKGFQVSDKNGNNQTYSDAWSSP